jgi:PHD/YefM family antitoxin component YafN of YafNO toxin-antitoxin module
VVLVHGVFGRTARLTTIAASPVGARCHLTAGTTADDAAQSVNFRAKMSKLASMGLMSSAVVVPSKEVRLPRRARDAVAKHRPVEVRNHDKPAYYVLHADDYAVVEALLARHRRGLPLPVAELLTDDDFEVLAEERELDAGLDRGILAGWEA